MAGSFGDGNIRQICADCGLRRAARPAPRWKRPAVSEALARSISHRAVGPIRARRAAAPALSKRAVFAIRLAGWQVAGANRPYASQRSPGHRGLHHGTTAPKPDFHTGRNSLDTVYGLELSVADDKLVVDVGETSGNIWLAPAAKR